MREREIAPIPETEAHPTPVPAAGQAPTTLTVARLLALQRTVGNRGVTAMLEGARRASISRCPGCGGTCRGACEKATDEEDGQERDDRLRAKAIGGGDEPSDTAPDPTSYVIIEDSEDDENDRDDEATEEEGAEDGTTAIEDQAPGRAKRVVVAVELAAPRMPIGAGASRLRTKAKTAVLSGAPPSNALGAGLYGLTMEESIDISVKAKKVGGVWKPVVKKLTGHFSQQTRLLPGQSEVTGPGGNTTQANYCDQVTGLNTLGNTLGNTWYMLRAVKKHENVHAAHFGPGLKAAEPAITASIEAVSVPDAPGMNSTKALAALKADGAFKTAAAAAKGLWSAQDDVLLANDHDAGGACDVAEHAVVDPMIKKICKHAKAKKWPACPVCPP